MNIVQSQPCAICMKVPDMGEGKHQCTTCAPDAWSVCTLCEEQIKGKECPICRSDYLREPASGWEDLPINTASIELDEQPSQSELGRIASRFPGLVTLEIRAEYCDSPEELEFAEVCFPALTRLTLSCVGLCSITFTEANTPLLQDLSLSNIEGSVCPFRLALPDLRTFDAEHSMLGERAIDAGQFGLSLSRCPKLEHFKSYKFRCLGDINYCVLPSMKSMNFHRSECTTHLDILNAPQLTSISLQAAYELGDGFKLRNLPNADLATVENLIKARSEAEKKARNAATIEDNRWRDQSNVKALTKEAIRRQWIEDDDTWEITATRPEFSDGFSVESLGVTPPDPSDGFSEEILADRCHEIFEKNMHKAVKEVEKTLLGHSIADEDLPCCTIDVTNMNGLSKDALEPQLQTRVKIIGSSFDDNIDFSGYQFASAVDDDDESDMDDDDESDEENMDDYVEEDEDSSDDE